MEAAAMTTTVPNVGTEAFSCIAQAYSSMILFRLNTPQSTA
jgi:hypothetical protein